MTPAAPASEFHELLSHPSGQIDLATAALLIARAEYVDLDVDRYRRMLDRLADGVRPRFEATAGNPFAAIDALNGHLFREEGFRGNHEDYFDPRNSYLNEVLDRRLGIPITLALVYMEVSARVGFPIEGVGFPGHFLVRHASGGREILVDPFHGGEILLPEDCRKLLKASYGSEMPLEPRFFTPIGPRKILVRMLNNLKHIHVTRSDYPKLLKVIEMLVAISPDDPAQVRDRGITHMKLSHLGRAASDLQRYIRLSPDASDAEAVRKQIKAIRRLTALLN